MPQIVTMPKLGSTMTSGLIARWLKREGEQVKVGDILFIVETDKISNEVVSPVDGYVLKILAQEDEEKEISAPICIIGGKDEGFDIDAGG